MSGRNGQQPPDGQFIDNFFDFASMVPIGPSSQKVRRVFVCLFHQKTECSFLSFFLSFFSRPISHFVRHRRPLSFYYILFQHLFMCPLFLPPSICQFTRHTHTHTRTAFVNRRVPENVIKEIKRRKK